MIKNMNVSSPFLWSMLSNNLQLTVKLLFWFGNQFVPLLSDIKRPIPSPPFIHYAAGMSFLTEIFLQSRQIHHKALQTTHVSWLSVSQRQKLAPRRVSIKAFAAQMGLWMQISVWRRGSFIQKAIPSCRSGCLMKWAYVKEQIRILKAHLYSRVSVSHRICVVVCFKTQRTASDGLTSAMPKSQLISIFLKLAQLAQNHFVWNRLISLLWLKSKIWAWMEIKLIWWRRAGRGGASKEEVHRTFQPCCQQDRVHECAVINEVWRHLTVKEQLIFVNCDVATKPFCFCLKGQQINSL